LNHGIGPLHSQRTLRRAGQAPPAFSGLQGAIIITIDGEWSNGKLLSGDDGPEYLNQQGITILDTRDLGNDCSTLFDDNVYHTINYVIDENKPLPNAYATYPYQRVIRSPSLAQAVPAIRTTLRPRDTAAIPALPPTPHPPPPTASASLLDALSTARALPPHLRNKTDPSAIPSAAVVLPALAFTPPAPAVG